MDGTQVGVFEQGHEVGFGSLLEGQDGSALPALFVRFRAKFIGNFADQSLEGQLADQQVGAPLVFANLTESHCPGAIAIWLFLLWIEDAFALGLLGEILAGGLSTSELASGLFGSGHWERSTRGREGGERRRGREGGTQRNKAGKEVRRREGKRRGGRVVEWL